MKSNAMMLPYEGNGFTPSQNDIALSGCLSLLMVMLVVGIWQMLKKTK